MRIFLRGAPVNRFRPALSLRLRLLSWPTSLISVPTIFSTTSPADTCVAVFASGGGGRGGGRDGDSSSGTGGVEFSPAQALAPGGEGKRFENAAIRRTGKEVLQVSRQCAGET